MNLMKKHPHNMGLFLGVGLTSSATLLLQISLVRIFSVALWHHFAFMVVSIAFLGFGASGTFLMMVRKAKELPVGPTLARLAFAFSIATLISYWASNHIPFDPARFMWDRYQWVYLLCYYFVLAVPFFFAGLILGLVYTYRIAQVGPLYAADLIGAAVGCTGILWVYPFAGESGSVLVVSLLAGAASLAFCPNGWKRNLARGVWMGTLCLMMIMRPEPLDLHISPYKALKVAQRYPAARILETRWHASGRLDIVQSGAVRFAPGLSFEFHGRLPEQLGLCVDAGALNAVTRFSGNTEDMAFTAFLSSALPYAIKKPEDVLVMEPMGGLDILAARYHGAKNIVTTHSNPLTLKVMKTSLKDFSGHLYAYEDQVRSVEAQGRHFLGRGQMAFDVIQLSLTDSLGALSSGLYGLSEDYTLTTEAFKTYLKALKPEGFFTVTQYLLPPPRHEIRLVALACKALEAMGMRQPASRLAAIRSWGTFTLVVKKRPFDLQEIHEMKAFCHRLRFDLVHYPNMPRTEANVYNRFPTPLYYDMIQKVLCPSKREDFYKSYLFDIQPVTDDKPFFYHHFKMNKAFSLYRAVGDKWQLFLEGGYLVHLILFQAVVIGLVLISLPLSKTGRPSSAWFVAYFGCIGLAFMFTEICLIQRFILFLAKPAYAFSTVLFSVLLASALGSYYSKKFMGRLPYLLLTPILLFGYAFCLDDLFTLAVGWPFWVRYGGTFLIILPLGFMMGMFFPTGMGVLSLSFERAVPWAWAVNGCASVVGSVLAVVVALGYGFTVVFCLAGLFYSLALGVLVLQNLSYHRHKDNPQ